MEKLAEGYEAVNKDVTVEVQQSDEAVSGVQEDISNGKVANFEDHY